MHGTPWLLKGFQKTHVHCFKRTDLPVSNTSSTLFIYPVYMRSCFLINTADRIIRVYDGREILTCGRDGEPEPMQKLQDLVNRYVNTEFFIITPKDVWLEIKLFI